MKEKNQKVEKTAEKKVSKINIMKKLLKAKTSEKEILKTFTKIYAGEGKKDKEYVARRIKIYRRIAG